MDTKQSTRPNGTHSILRAMSMAVLAALGLAMGTPGTAHAQEPPITVRFEKDFHQYGESSQSGRITLEARTAANVAPTENFTLTVFTEDANTEMPLSALSLSALAGSDFTAFRRTYTFRPSEFALEAGQYVARKLVQLQITDDDVVEKINSFGVVIERANLPTHVTLHSIKFSVALVIINNDDEAQISASAPRTVTEGKTYDYVLTVDNTVDFPFQVVISTVDMTASPADGDYVHFTNVFEFEPRQRRLVRRVRTLADTRIESNEQLGVKVVGNGLDASIHLPDDPTTVTIIIDATTPDWTVTHTPAQGATTTVKEDRGTWGMTVDSGGVTWPTDQSIRLDLTPGGATADGCTAGAVHGEDFHVSDDSDLSGHAADTLILRAGRTRVTATFAIVDDAHYEPPESVIVSAHHETQRIATPHVVTIRDNETTATLQEATVDGRTATLTFDTPMGRLTPRTDPDDVHYVERPNPPGHFFTLFEGEDEPTDGAIGVSAYRVRYGTLASTFALAGRTVTLTFPHAVRAGTKAWLRYDRFAVYAPLGPTTESLRCTNGRPRHAVASFITALDGTANTGGPATLPALTITGGEGREGTNSHIAFTVRLNPASTETVAVDYKTVSRTATEGEDFTRTRGTLEFAPGERTKTVRVPITDDTVEDDGETFLLDLYDVSGATLDKPSHATGTIRNSEDAPTGNEHAVTARFASVPAEHGGPGEANRFTFDLTFSEAPEVSYRTLRDHAFTVTGGDVKKAKRKVQGSNRSWTIHVEPQGWGAVTVTLPGGRACSAPGAVCTSDSRQLANSPSATVSGPAALSVADASAHENSGDDLNFNVSLDRVSTLTVTVDYATSNGTATAASDYVATSGTLTFHPGDAAKNVKVQVLGDAIDDGIETMTLTLSNATNARIADATATGTIENSDPIPQAWLARFGRTVADHVVDAISGRLEGSPGGGSQVMLGGQRVPLDGAGNSTAPGATAGNDTKETAAAADTLAAFAERMSDDGAGTRRVDWGAPVGADAAERPASRSLTERELLVGSSFFLALGGDGAQGPGTAWTAWGRAASSSFDGEADGLVLDGDVTTFTLGADAAWSRWLAGVAVSLSEGTGGFRDQDDTGDPNHPARGSGALESSLTSVHPYARLEVSERLMLWGILGYGTGELTMEVEDDERWTTDTAMEMAAVGARGVLVAAAETGGFELATRTDAVMQRMRSEAASGSDGGNLAATESGTSRLRVMLEGSRSFEVSGGTLTPSLEAGLRHDGGDAETGTGIEVGGGVSYSDPATGFTVQAGVRGLVAHEDTDYREWGASASVRLDPGAAGRGLSLSLSPAWGADSGNAERLWGLSDARGLATNDSFEPAGRLDAEAGWGLGAFGGRGLMTPFAGLALSDAGDRTWRTGVRWTLGADISLGLEGTRREPANDDAPAHGVMLRGGLRW